MLKKIIFTLLMLTNPFIQSAEAEPIQQSFFCEICNYFVEKEAIETHQYSVDHQTNFSILEGTFSYPSDKESSSLFPTFESLPAASVAPDIKKSLAQDTVPDRAVPALDQNSLVDYSLDELMADLQGMDVTENDDEDEAQKQESDDEDRHRNCKRARKG